MVYLHCCGNLVKVPYQESIGSQLRNVVIADGESGFEAKKSVVTISDLWSLRGQYM